MEGNKTLKCVIHYGSQKNCPPIKRLSEITQKQILDAKAKRKRIGGEDTHEEQCSGVPAKFDAGTHGVHLEPHYKR